MKLAVISPGILLAGLCLAGDGLAGMPSVEFSTPSIGNTLMQRVGLPDIKIIARQALDFADALN